MANVDDAVSWTHPAATCHFENHDAVRLPNFHDHTFQRLSSLSLDAKNIPQLNPATTPQ